MKIQRLHPEAKIPTRATDGSAGFDLYALTGGHIYAGCRSVAQTGIAVAVPDGWYGRIAPRSGLAMRHGITILGGVVDSDYRGEVKVILLNTRSKPWEWQAGDRIAQLVIERCWTGNIEVVDSLDTTDRLGGFGSSGR